MPELFNFDDDLEESHDVSERHPHIVEELLERLEQFDAEVRADHAARYPTVT